MRSSLLLWSGAIALSSAQTYGGNFPAKSINLASADNVAYYNVYTEAETQVFDAHAVHGAPTSDGGWVVVGKGLEADGSSITESFAVKFTSSGARQWSFLSGHSGSDAFNAVVQLGTGGDLIAVGHREVSGVYMRCITKLTIATGVASWVATSFGDSAGANGGYENVELSTDGATMYAGGFTGKPGTDEYSFKSYGNVAGGSALIDAFPVSALGSSAPTSASLSWTTDLAPRGTVKAVRAFSAGGLAALTFTDAGSSAEVVRLDAGGTTSWGPTDIAAQHGEGTEMVISPGAISRPLASISRNSRPS